MPPGWWRHGRHGRYGFLIREPHTDEGDGPGHQRPVSLILAMREAGWRRDIAHLASMNSSVLPRMSTLPADTMSSVAVDRITALMFRMRFETFCTHPMTATSAPSAFAAATAQLWQFTKSAPVAFAAADAVSMITYWLD